MIRGEFRSASREEERVEKARKIINEEQWHMILEIAGRLGLSYVTCLQIISEDLNRRWISSNSLSWLLTDEEKQRKFFAAKNSAVVSRPPKSLQVTPCDFFLFPSKTLQLRGCNFQDIRDT